MAPGAQLAARDARPAPFGPKMKGQELLRSVSKPNKKREITVRGLYNIIYGMDVVEGVPRTTEAGQLAHACANTCCCTEQRWRSSSLVPVVGVDGPPGHMSSRMLILNMFTLISVHQ